MPELPGVEVERRYPDARFRRRTSTGIRAHHPDVLSETLLQALGGRLKGRAVESRVS